MVNYTLGDFLIRIKNASLAGRREFVVKNIKIITTVAEVLVKEGFLEKVTKDKDNLIVNLAFRRKNPVLLDLKLISTPGLRVYMGVDELGRKKGPSVLLVSTPKGIMIAKDAVKKRLGGEIIAEVW